MSLITLEGRPRRFVPWSTRLVVLLGGMLSGIGCLFLGFGMILVWVLADKGDYSSAFLMRGKLETAPAVVSAVEDTQYSAGGVNHRIRKRIRKRREGTPIFAHAYKFQSGGRDYEGTSYRKGEGARVGDRVTVEFPAGRPDYSRILGMRRAVFDSAVAVTFVFPAIGLAMVLPGLWQCRKDIRLLARGEIAEGRLVNKEPTNTKVNNRTVYKLTFEFSGLNGQVQRAIAKTSFPEKLSDEGLERLFYDPRNPANSTLLDNLPGNQALTDRGELRPCTLGKVLRTIIPPFAALAIVVGGILVKLFG
jgi:hypothetical protein